MAKVLIAVPELSLPGGVANIYRAISWEDQDGVSYFFNTTKYSRNKLWFIPVMFLKFLLVVNQFSLIQLNPSLDGKAIFRDGLLLVLAKLFRKKVIVFFHGWDDTFEDRIKNNAIFKATFSFIFNKADGFLLLGSVFKKKLSGLGVHNRNIFFLPTVAENVYFPKVKPPSNQITILFLARFVPSKGMDIVLQTFAKLQRSPGDRRFNLIMAGDGPELENCKKYVRAQNLVNVTFTGSVAGKEKHDCYNNSHILFFPTYTEGLPCVIMEAMSYGLAIVTRPVGGIPDWIIHDENGWISESTDCADFEKGILSLTENPAKLKEIGERNQLIALNKFSPRAFKQELQYIFRKILGDQSLFRSSLS